LDLPDKV